METNGEGGRRRQTKLTHLRNPLNLQNDPQKPFAARIENILWQHNRCSVCLSAGDMAMKNYAGDSAQKFPQIFISTSEKRVSGPSAPAVPYPTVLPVLTVQLEAVLRTSLSVGQQTGQDQEPLPQTHNGNRFHRSPWLWTAGWPKGQDLSAGGAWLLMPSRWRHLSPSAGLKIVQKKRMWGYLREKVFIWTFFQTLNNISTAKTLFISPNIIHNGKYTVFKK